MESKFTYLIGAGASAEALPVVSQFEARISHFCVQLEIDLKRLTRSNEQWISFIFRLKSFASTSSRFGTIDTLAKYYYLTDKISLYELKKALSVYFVLEQLFYHKRDNRYLQFLTTILDSVLIPKKLKILTWNYDFQFELAAMNFKEDKIAEPNSEVNVSSQPLISYYPSCGISQRPNPAKDIDLLHINGIAGFFNNQNDKLVGSAFHVYDPTALTINSKLRIELLDSLNGILSDKTIPIFNFAWEDNGLADIDRLDYVGKMILETSHLVIIGYSFPFFNRNIDNVIFQSMLSSRDMEKIYYQDPEIDGQFLKKQFDIHKDCEIVHVEDVKNFFIPTEF